MGQRERVSPPYVPLRALRSVSGKTLDEVCADFEEITGRRLTRGALSAIETGLRRPSAGVLDGLARAYGISPDDLDTHYVPRQRAA